MTIALLAALVLLLLFCLLVLGSIFGELQKVRVAIHETRLERADAVNRSLAVMQAQVEAEQATAKSFQALATANLAVIGIAGSGGIRH